MIKLISSKVARILCEDEKHTDNYELYEYAIYILLSSAFHIATVIVLGLVFNLLTESLVFYLSFIAIRKFAGGYHAKTPVRCYAFSVISSIIMLCLIKYANSVGNIFTYLLIIFELLCVVLIILMSPLDTENNPLNSYEKKWYKTLAVLISVCIFIISLFCVLTELRNIGYSLICGVIMSTLVLLMRKVQITN
ncbi:accessory gene regulator ArgB-like protein [Ruminococcus sp.]|uniref:accessory gene regulator ArgB-like protein n=1 Tax=Ruminococcus sp. TaxID=41978 RepID=UPI00352266AF